MKLCTCSARHSAKLSAVGRLQGVVLFDEWLNAHLRADSAHVAQRTVAHSSSQPSFPEFVLVIFVDTRQEDSQTRVCVNIITLLYMKCKYSYTPINCV